MNRTLNLCKVLGWQGGTIHQVAEATGLSVSTILDGKSREGSADFHGGWFAARTCSLEWNRAKNFPANQGNEQFWLGAAAGIQFGTVDESND